MYFAFKFFFVTFAAFVGSFATSASVAGFFAISGSAADSGVGSRVGILFK